jgi:hypothetical protein
MRRFSIANVCAAFVLMSFTCTYSFLCFHASWDGDIYVYVAGISEVLRDFPHLLHEASQQPGTESIAFTPYLISLSLVSKLISLSPYEILQYAGIINCFLFSAATIYLFASICPNKNALISAALFVLTVIFVRGRTYLWSSELSVETVAWIQAYPSFFAWSLGMFCFGLCHRLLQATRIFGLLIFGFLVWTVFLTHNITGSWVVLVVSVYALAQIALSIPAKRWSPTYRALGCLVVVVTALLGTLAWPYGSVLGNLQIAAVHENAPFSGKPLASFPLLYLLSIPAYYWCWRYSRSLAILLIAGFGVTLAAYGLFRIVSDYFDRYVFFLAFFPQVLIAAVLTDNIEKLITGRTQKLFDPSLGLLGRGFIVAFPVAFFTVLVASAAVRNYSIIGFRSDSRTVFENQFPRLVGALSESDIVAECPITNLTLFLFLKTGARFVLSSSSYRGQSKMARQADLDALFRSGSVQELNAIIQRYGITKALVHPDCYPLNPFFVERLTELVATEDKWTIYSVAGNTPPAR